MLVGSYYLGKKARKAYRNRQAEKVAKQLVDGVDIVDPSEELKFQAPPASPVQQVASPSPVYSGDQIKSQTEYSFSPNEHSNASRSALTPSSTYLYHGQSSTTEHSEDFARFNARDPARMIPEEPPSYDVVINSPADPRLVSSSDHINDGRPAHVHVYQGPLAPREECPTCVAMLHRQHQARLYHIHPQHTYAVYHPHWQTSVGAAEMPSELPVVAELPELSKPERRTRDSDSTPMQELPDTSQVTELPADLPAVYSPVELPADAAVPDTEVKAGADAKVDTFEEWKTAEHLMASRRNRTSL